MNQENSSRSEQVYGNKIVWHNKEPAIKNDH